VDAFGACLLALRLTLWQVIADVWQNLLWRTLRCQLWGRQPAAAFESMTAPPARMLDSVTSAHHDQQTRIGSIAAAAPHRQVHVPEVPAGEAA